MLKPTRIRTETVKETYRPYALAELSSGAWHELPSAIQAEFSPRPTAFTPYRYHVTHHLGGETAEEVKIELVLKTKDVDMEKTEMNLPFIPHASKREGWVNFMTDPGKADALTDRAISFKKP